MRYNFCTLFDRNYASRGLALYRSLERVCAQEFHLTILCIDIETRDALAKLVLPKARLWLVEDLGDTALMDVRKTRPLREFCWTCPGPLMLALLREAAPGEVVTYLDADLSFFSDLKPVFDELSDKNIFIHGHRFAPRHRHMESSSGIFNVGLVAIRRSPEGIACLERWRAQCLEVCELNPEKGYCGDQKYLDEWPSLYKNLVIATHPGICLAPWNIEARDITEQDGQVMVDGQKLIFYHYHSLRLFSTSGDAGWAVQPAAGYAFTEVQRRLIYRTYATMLVAAQAQLADAGLRTLSPKLPLHLYVRSWWRNDLIFA